LFGDGVDAAEGFGHLAEGDEEQELGLIGTDVSELQRTGRG
jgi:hypothetical protein